jgi:hypothetical protein
MSYGSSLGITAGVKGVTNDTALTRAQCAVLIYNALKAPILAINGYQYDNLGNLVPKFEAMDGKSGRDWASMLTEYHDAYVVKGRVSSTHQSSKGALDADEVVFEVEWSENFDESPVKINQGAVLVGTLTSEQPTEMKIGSTNAADLLFTYSEAIAQKDAYTDEWTLISVTPYGANKTVEIEADNVRILGEAGGEDPISSFMIAVAKSESSASTTKYRLETKEVANVDQVATKLYVNGVEVPLNITTFNKYINNNKGATVTLIDSTNDGSTSTNGYYDYIMVDYYETAVVDTVNATDSSVKVFFKNSTESRASRLSYDPENENCNVIFTKDGEEIAVTDLVEGDVISIAYDVAANIADGSSTFYNVVVSSNAPVTGMAQSHDDTEGTVTIGGTEYDVVSNITPSSDCKLGTEYTAY